MIVINNVLWDVMFVPPYNPNLYRQDGTVTIGMCDNNDRIIYIDNSIGGSLLRKVLCHEIVHASMYSYGIYLTDEQEELVANIISTYGDEIIEKTNLIFSKLQNNY